MKKGALNVLLIAIISCILPSCSGQKSLQELLQEEKKAIDRFIAMKDNNLVILKEYPTDGVFKENEYFRPTDGLFFQVVDSGNGRRAQLGDDISVRFDYLQLVKDAVAGDTTKWEYPYHPYYSSSSLSPLQPISFTYGILSTYSSSNTPVCKAWVLPLEYIGEGAVLNMIVQSTVGSYNDYNSVRPVFYKNLRYTRFN